MNKLQIMALRERRLISLSGEDRRAFLQGLVTNDVEKLTDERILWAAYLTPQGRFLHEFMLIDDPKQQRILIDCANDDSMMALGKSLRSHVLSYQVKLTIESDLACAILLNEADQNIKNIDPYLALPDPRGLGIRLYVQKDQLALYDDHIARAAFDYERIKAAIPAQAMDLIPERSLLLETNFDMLGGVSWEKGCYRGQELTARTKYRALIKKRLMPVQIEAGNLEAGQKILDDTGLEIAHITSASKDIGLALMPFKALMQHGMDQVFFTEKGAKLLLLKSMPLWLKEMIDQMMQERVQ